MYVRYTVLVQKGNKDIIKVVHVTSVGKLEFFEASEIHFGPKIYLIISDIFIFPFWTRTVYRVYIFNGGTESSRTKYKIS